MTVSLENNPGIAGYLLYITFDTTVFTVTEVENLKSGYIRFNDYYENGERKGVKIIAASSMDYTEDGALFSMKLQVSEDAEIGEYDVGISYSKEDTVNENGQEIALSIGNGKVVLEEPTLMLSPQTSETDEEVTILLSMRNSPGITGVKCTVRYDTNKFELQSVQPLAKGTIIYNDHYYINNDDQGAKIAWLGEGAPGKELPLFSLTFHVVQNIPPDQYTFTIQEVEVSDQKNRLISVEKVDGTVTVSKASVVLTGGEVGNDKVSFSLKNTTKQQTAMAVCGCYGMTGQLIDIRVLPIKLTEGTKYIDLPGKDFSYVKIFVLDETLYGLIGNSIKIER